MDVGPGKLDRRHQSEEDGTQNGNCQRKNQNTEIHVNKRCGKESVGTQGGEGFGPRKSEKQSQETADGGEKQAFGEQLANDSSSRGAERTANRHLFSTRQRARQQQAVYIGAGNQQHKA